MSKALGDVRVLDLSRLLPGGFCSLMLADFGAEVLKVEDTGMGDYIRWSPPYYEGADDTAKSALYLSLNRGKRSIRINLKEERGREVLLRLARDYDVLLESFRPGVLDRLGVGYERLREENPGLVYCAISGYGQDGPFRDRSGHDMNYLGLIGLLGITGERDGPPVQAGGQIADIGGGAMMAAFGIMAALRERERSGEGQLVDVSMADGSLSWLAMIAARYFCEGTVPEARRARALGRAHLLPALRVQRRLGHARCARAEVLAGVVPRGRARGSDRAAVRVSRRRGARRGGAHLPRAHARPVAGVRHPQRLLPRARPRPRRGARLGARARARDGRGARPAGSRPGEAARHPDQAEPHPRQGRRPGPGPRRAHRRGPRSRRLHARGHRGAEGIGSRGRRDGQRRPARSGHDPRPDDLRTCDLP